MSETAKASDPPVAAKADLRSPDQWALQQFPMSKRGVLPLEFAHHMTAAGLHEWNDHAMHAGKPLLISADDYAAALTAAQTPDEKGNYTPHWPAMSAFTSRKPVTVDVAKDATKKAPSLAASVDAKGGKA